MKKINKSKFSEIYNTTLNEIFKYWNKDMQMHISKHNKSWEPSKFDFYLYLKASEKRFYNAYSLIEEDKKSVCDVGGFFGVFPVVLAKLGYEVYMTESLKYYTNAFDDMFKYIQSSGVTIIDVDPFEKNVLPINKFDIVTSLAVIEHYPHSLRIFMNNLSSSINETGEIIIEVPNIAYLYNRLKLLKGETPLSNIKMILESDIPFIGHHHEFTEKELHILFEDIDFKISNINYFNYSNNYSDIRFIIQNPFKSLMFNLFKSTRECIIAKASYDKNK